MKKKLLMLGLALMFFAVPTLAATGGRGPSGGHGGGHVGGHAPAVRASNYHGGSVHRPPVHHASVSAGHRVPPAVHRPVGRPLPPPLYRPYRFVYSPYYYSYYPYYPTTYYTTSYTYYPTYDSEVVEPVPATTETVVIKDNYAGINTAANVINAAANVAATIRYLTW